MVAAHSVVVGGRSGAPGHVLPAAGEKRRVGGIEVSFYNALGCGRCLVSDSDCRRAVTRGDRRSISSIGFVQATKERFGSRFIALVIQLQGPTWARPGGGGGGCGPDRAKKKKENFGPRIAHRKKYSRGSAPTGDRRGG